MTSPLPASGFLSRLRRPLTVSGVFFLTEQACGPEPRLLGVHKTQFLLAALGAEALGPRLGLGPRHLLERAGEHDGLAGDGAPFRLRPRRVARRVRPLLPHGTSGHGLRPVARGMPVRCRRK